MKEGDRGGQPGVLGRCSRLGLEHPTVACVLGRPQGGSAYRCNGTAVTRAEGQKAGKASGGWVMRGKSGQWAPGGRKGGSERVGETERSLPELPHTTRQTGQRGSEPVSPAQPQLPPPPGQGPYGSAQDSKRPAHSRPSGVVTGGSDGARLFLEHVGKPQAGSSFDVSPLCSWGLSLPTCTMEHSGPLCP